MSSLKCILDNLPKDKKIHFWVGFLTVMVMSFFTSYGISVMFSILVGILKEMYDKYINKEDAKFEDFLWTISGGFLSGILITIIKIVIFSIF